MISRKEAQEIAADLLEGEGKLSGEVREAEDCYFFSWIKLDGTKDAASGPILVDKDLGESWILSAEVTESELTGSKVIDNI